MKLDVRLDPRLSGLCAGARLAGTVATGAGGDARSVDAWLELTEHAGGHRHVARRTDPLRLHHGAVPPGPRAPLRAPDPARRGALARHGVGRARLDARRPRRPAAARPDARAELVLEIL